MDLKFAFVTRLRFFARLLDIMRLLLLLQDVYKIVNVLQYSSSVILYVPLNRDK